MTELRECPFCGGGETRIDENRLRPTMAGQGSLVSVEIHHWCPASEGQPRRNHMVKVGRDRASAISAWNRRADDWQPIETAPRDGTRVIVCAGKWEGVAYWNTNPQLWEGDDLACWTVFEPDDYFYAVHLRGDDCPTHWRPLPKGPGG